MRLMLAATAAIAVATSVLASSEFVVHETSVEDRKAVIATVEPVRQLVARARIGGTVTSLKVREGDEVGSGAEIAVVADQKLALQMQALELSHPVAAGSAGPGACRLQPYSRAAAAGRFEPIATRTGADSS